MGSLWGTKNDRVGDEDSEDTAVASQDRSTRPTSRRTLPAREEDERAPLLPRDHPRAGYLSPDDPAVTPLNLWSVRILRGLTVLFLAATFIWWVLMLVSIFVTPPGMHTRGSGFTDFSFTTLAMFNLLIALLFFSVPSKALEVSNMAVGLFLLIDMILIVSVTRIREEEGWPGIASVVWALLMAIYNVLTDRVVAWGKKEEEERLTGREETRRSLKEWLGVVAETFAMTIVLAVTLFLTATLILRSRDASLEAPGKKYWVGANSYQVHLYCKGPKESNVTVLFEAGEDPAEWHLLPFADQLFTKEAIPRYCIWDRPGVAFSDNAPSPLSASMATDALTEALAQADEEGPWVLVGPGVGSFYTRIFAADHPGQIKGMMLLDPDHEDLLWKIASPGRGFMLWAWGIISPLGIDRLIGAIFKGRTREDRIWGQSSYQNGRRIKSQLQENLMANGLTKSDVVHSRRTQDPEVPLVVISSGIRVRSDSEWERKQKDLTKLTENLQAWDIIRGEGHDFYSKPGKGQDAIEKRLTKLVEK